MFKVWKYDVPIDDYFELNMPIGAQVLTVDVQAERPCLWALVDPDMPKEKRRFRFAGTGHPINEPENRLRFINTFQMRGGSLIFHIFEVLN